MDVDRVRQWVVHFNNGDSDSVLPPLVQIFGRLLFISGENAQPDVSSSTDLVQLNLMHIRQQGRISEPS